MLTVHGKSYIQNTVLGAVMKRARFPRTDAASVSYKCGLGIWNPKCHCLSSSKI